MSESKNSKECLQPIASAEFLIGSNHQTPTLGAMADSPRMQESNNALKVPQIIVERIDQERRSSTSILLGISRAMSGYNPVPSEVDTKAITEEHENREKLRRDEFECLQKKRQQTEGIFERLVYADQKKGA